MAKTNRICSVDGCGKFCIARGLCHAHCERARRNGDPLKRQRAPKGEAMRWLQSNAKMSSDECLSWPFSVGQDGYGRVLFNGTKSTASRVMCELVHGPAPSPDHQAAHSCGKGHLGCVNPAHLRWDTVQGNQLERAEHGTSNRGERQHLAVLTEDLVRQIKAMSDRSPAEVSRALGVSYANAYHVLKGESWAWLE